MYETVLWKMETKQLVFKESKHILAAVVVKRISQRNRGESQWLVLWASSHMRSRFRSFWGDFTLEIDFQELPIAQKMFFLPKFYSISIYLLSFLRPRVHLRMGGKLEEMVL